jgi:Mg2+/Co2+ transporter CorB
MADPTVAIWIGVLVALVACSAFFSSSESAIFSLGTAAVPGDSPAAAALAELREDPHRLLVTLLVGNNVVNVAIASITTLVLTEHLPAGVAVTASTVVASTIVLIFGEIVPKSYGLGHAEEWALRVARPIALVGRVLLPLVVLFDWITRHLNAVIGGESAIEKAHVEE